MRALFASARTRAPLPADWREEARRRLDLFSQPPPVAPKGPPARLLLAEAQVVLSPLQRWLTPPKPLPQAVRPRVVMLLPGLGTRPERMRPLAQALEGAGHAVKQWGQGWNFGPTAENFARLEERLEAIFERHGEQVVLVGWSLGGIFARELAKRRPERVAKVVTMGTPFSGGPYANNGWRMYQLLSGRPVDEPPFETDVAAKPPVETVALWSPRDGMISPRSACGRPGERDRAVALRCTHNGFAWSDEAIRAVAAELERD